MKKKLKIDSEQIGELNRARILQLLREEGPLTKSDLGQSLGVSHTTVNTHVAQLLEQGLVTFSGTAQSTGGRKPVVIALVKEAGFSFGANFTSDLVEMVLMDFSGEILDKWQMDFHGGDKFGQTLDQVKDRVWKEIEERNLPVSKVLGLGITFPGLVDDKNLKLKLLANMGISHYGLSQFKEELGLPLFVDNEANSGAYAEQRMGPPGKKNFVYLSVSEGIGAGVVVENHIVRGETRRAGEFGHLKITDKPAMCTCGRNGCWQVLASAKALANGYRGGGRQGLDLIMADYKAGDKEAIKRVDSYLVHLFTGIESILVTLDPEDIFLGGDLGKYGETLIKIGTEKLNLTEGFYGYDIIPIKPSVLEDKGPLVGSGFLALEPIYRYEG